MLPLFEVFPLDKPAKLEDLQCLAGRLAEEAAASGADPHAWVFDVSCDNLPASPVKLLRPAQPELRFDPWLYEHGSPWIVPYL